MPKNLLGRIIKRFRNFRAWKIFLQKKEISLLSVSTFFPRSAEKFHEGKHSTFQKHSGIEKFYAKGGGLSLFSVETSFFTVPKTFVGGINQCFRNISAWKIFLQKKEILIISVATFFSHSAQFFVKRMIQCIRNIRAWRSFIKRRGFHYFLSELCFSQRRNFSWEELFNVSGKIGHGKILCRRRRYHFFLFGIFFSHSADKFTGRN